MVREVGVHNDDEVARCELQAVDISGAEAELAAAGVQFHFGGAVGFDQLVGDFLRAVGGAVINDDDFVVEFAGAGFVRRAGLSEADRWGAYCSVKVWLRSQIMMGRLRRSL